MSRNWLLVILGLTTASTLSTGVSTGVVLLGVPASANSPISWAGTAYNVDGAAKHDLASGLPYNAYNPHTRDLGSGMPYNAYNPRASNPAAGMPYD